MDWHCVESVTNNGVVYKNYHSVNAIANPAVMSSTDAEAFCSSVNLPETTVIQAGDQTLTAVIQQALEIPPVEDLQQIWMTGFALPVICYLTAWGFQTVIAWFEKGEH